MYNPGRRFWRRDPFTGRRFIAVVGLRGLRTGTRRTLPRRTRTGRTLTRRTLTRRTLTRRAPSWGTLCGPTLSLGRRTHGLVDCLVQLVVADSRRVKRIRPPPVGQRELRHSTDVVGHGHRSALKAGQRGRGPADCQVGPQSLRPNRGAQVAHLSEQFVG